MAGPLLNTRPTRGRNDAAMPLTLSLLLLDAGINPSTTLVIRHAFTQEPKETGLVGLHADSSHADVLEYTRNQSADTRRFPSVPPRLWVVFIKEGGNRARLWSVVENRGETANNGIIRTFDVTETEHLADLRDRLVIGWKSPRTWRLNGATAGTYPVVSIADAEPIPFPGFDRLILTHTQLQSVMREQHYASWRTALSAVVGIYLITDMSDGRHYVGKADGLGTIRQRWSAYAANGHGGNAELKGLDPSHFQFSLLRVFDPATSARDVDIAESHFKNALGSRRHGLNRN